MVRRASGEGTVYHDVNRGRWIAEVSVLGRRRRRVALTQKAAVQALKELTRDAEQGVAVDGSLTVGTLLESWRTSFDAKGLAPQTQVAYGWCVDVITERLGTAKARKLTPERVEQFFAELASEGIARATLVKMRSVLSQAFDRAERRGHVARNPARVADLPTNAKRSERGEALTPEQVDSLLTSAVDSPLAACWTVMAYCGLRPGEALGLHWSDIEGDVLHVRRSLKIVDGSAVVTDALKTAGSRRSLRMPTLVVTALVEHKALQGRLRAEAGDVWHKTPLVFTTGEGTPYRPENARRSFYAACDAAGIGRWHPNDLRHAFATEMGERGVPLERIADALGHTTTRMAYETYRRRPKVVTLD